MALAINLLYSYYVTILKALCLKFRMEKAKVTLGDNTFEDLIEEQLEKVLEDALNDVDEKTTIENESEKEDSTTKKKSIS